MENTKNTASAAKSETETRLEQGMADERYEYLSASEAKELELRMQILKEELREASAKADAAEMEAISRKAAIGANIAIVATFVAHTAMFLSNQKAAKAKSSGLALPWAKKQPKSMLPWKR